jgi:lysozyme family protein
MDFFPAAVSLVLEEEGIFSDDAHDKGGATYFGISRTAHPTIPWPPTKEQAIALYKSQYWTAHRCDEMTWPWSLAIFDAAVNQTGLAIKILQKTLSLVVDGVVGDKTLEALGGLYSADHFRMYLALRADAYFRNQQYDTFGPGWLSRLIRIAQESEHPPGIT